MKSIKVFSDLNSWKYGHQLVLDIYKITNKFPSSEKFGLTDQMRRSAVSVTSNIAEGFSRQSKKEKIQFYFIAKGSFTELQNQLIISKDIGYLHQSSYKKIINDLEIVNKLVTGLIYSAKDK